MTRILIPRSGYTRPGLTQAEAARRLIVEGANVLDEPRSRNLMTILSGTLREPMFLLLAGAAVLYLAVGDLSEGLFMVAGASLSIGLTVLQEARSERALAALRKLAEPTARAIRDGTETRIPARELVRDDIILIGEGERPPADALLIEGDALTVDELALSGESVPVVKRLASHGDALSKSEQGGDDSPFLFAGTMVVRGQGVAQVLATGRSTKLGAVGALLANGTSEPTLLQKRTARLVTQLGLLALGFCAVVALAYGLVLGAWKDGALAAITLAIALVPEEFPMVLAIFLALGAWRLARHNTLVRRSAAIESLGSASMLFVDKTGTLTENRMSVHELWSDGEKHPLPIARPTRAIRQLVEIAALASAPRPVDPMDRALQSLSREFGVGLASSQSQPLRTYPLRPERLAFIQAWQRDAETLFAAKGAPEAIFHLCRLSQQQAMEHHAVVSEMAAQGMRVLGVAACRQKAFVEEDPGSLIFALVGLVGFHDPIRPEVPAAIAQARRAGIDVVMVTGDYPATAVAIARSAGIDIAAGVLTGAEVAKLDAPALRERVKSARVFARVTPGQKLALVNAMKASDHVVAMTGDGVNDAPALEAADIGIAMGRRGTDVARESADIILLDDRFASIVEGVSLGRRIFSNIRKALVFVTAIHVPIAGLSLLPIIVGLPPLFFPMHVVLLEFIVDPVCSIVFESEPNWRDAMEQPPRPKNEPLFGLRELVLGIAQGAVIFAVVMVGYAWLIHFGTAPGEARALALVMLVVGELALAFGNSAEPGTSFFALHRKAYWIISAAAAAVITAVIFVPAFARIFQISVPGWSLLLPALGAGILSGAWLGLYRRFRRA